MDGKDVLKFTSIPSMTNNSFAKAMRGELPRAIEDSLIETNLLGNRFTNILLGDEDKMKTFAHIIYDLNQQKGRPNTL